MDTFLAVLTYLALNVFVLAFIAVFLRLILSLFPNQKNDLTPIQRERQQERLRKEQERLSQDRERISQEKLIQRERQRKEKLIQRERDRKEKHSISTSCPDCGSFVSTMAYACPKCGRLSKVAASRATTQSCAINAAIGMVICVLVALAIALGIGAGIMLDQQRAENGLRSIR